ncbi:MAG: hypothetical protein QM777_19670 [Pseudorhodoferax sp.]
MSAGQPEVSEDGGQQKAADQAAKTAPAQASGGLPQCPAFNIGGNKVMRQTAKFSACVFLLAAWLCSGCGNLLGTSTDDDIYINGAPIPKGPVSIERHYSFRFF